MGDHYEEERPLLPNNGVDQGRQGGLWMAPSHLRRQRCVQGRGDRRRGSGRRGCRNGMKHLRRATYPQQKRECTKLDYMGMIELGYGVIWR